MLANDIRNYRRMDDYIAHHGILGQKWGKKSGPPYPLAAGSHSSSEKKAASAAGVKVGKSSGKGSSEGLNITQSGQKEKPGLIGSMIEGAKNAKLNKHRKQALEKAREAKVKKAEEKAAAEAHEAERKKALESGDYKQIQKYAHEVSTKELQDALTRADTLSRLNQAVDKTTPKEKDIWSTIDDVANKVGTATNAFNKGKDAWNAFAKAANTFMDEDSMLPEIGTNIAEQKEKKRKEREENERKNKIEEITKSLDPEKIMKNQDLFNDKELSSAVARLTAYNNIKKEKKAQEEEKAAEKQQKLDAKAEKKTEKEAKKLKKALEEASSKPLDSDDGLEYISMLENDNSRMNFSDPKYDHITDDWDFF